MNNSILHITVRADYGGGPEHLFRLVSEIKNEHKCFIACPDDYPYFEKYGELLGSEKIIKIPHRKFKISYLLNLKSFIGKNKISIIHSHGKGAGIYSRILKLLLPRIKCVHTYHGVHIGSYFPIQKSLYILMEQLFSKLTNAFITVSSSEKKQILDLKLCSPHQLHLINNGVEIPEQTNRPENNKFEIVTITRFDYQKNSELLTDIAATLKNLKELEDFRFNIIGTGEGENKLKAEIEKLSLQEYFNFIGTTNEPISVLKNMDCYISTSRWEGLPLAVLEAMSCGLPIIATNVIGHTEIIRDKNNGFLYNISSPKEAAHNLIELKNNVKLQIVFSKNSRNIVKEKFCIERMAKETLAVYKELNG